MGHDEVGADRAEAEYPSPEEEGSSQRHAEATEPVLRRVVTIHGPAVDDVCSREREVGDPLYWEEQLHASDRASSISTQSRTAQIATSLTHLMIIQVPSPRLTFLNIHHISPAFGVLRCDIQYRTRSTTQPAMELHAESAAIWNCQ